MEGCLLIYIFNQFLFLLKRCFCIHCDSLSSHISAYRTNQTSPEGFLLSSNFAKFLKKSGSNKLRSAKFRFQKVFEKKVINKRNQVIKARHERVRFA